MKKKFLKFLNFIFVLIIFNFFCLAPVYAHQAIVLSDAELDNVSAAGFDIDINAVLAFRSAVLAQSNIGVVKAGGVSGGVSAVSITNSNLAQLDNIGNSAVAIQNNLATIVAKVGNIMGANIENSNTADVGNTANAAGSVEASSLHSNCPLGLSEINQVFADGSAVASQNNLAVVAAPEGEVSNVVINNSNIANINNSGNSAVAAQSNIAVVVAEGNISNVDITNTNSVTELTNTGVGAGGVNIHNLTYQGWFGHHQINHILVDCAAVAAQSNIAVVISKGGSLHNVNINQHNPSPGIQVIHPD